MALKKLPSDVQLLMRASTKITGYRRAIEELVYNSLDANSTSIAIRINMEDSVIQVIDNGCGITKQDFALLGQKYTTSKCIDLTTLKSVPNKYGFRGQSLANLIEVSKNVKITSKHEHSEETWMKTFYKGKERELTELKERPSKGTTVEIKDFLYNLKIQKKSVNALIDLANVKNFLEQLSLVHTNISLSLRDDTKNVIVFNVHKNRDIYQTLQSIYDINKTQLQELKVEKNQYKVAAFMGKKDIETIPKHWIFLNGRMIHNSKLHKLVDEYLSKSLGLRKQRKQTKVKKVYQEEDEGTRGKIPFYLIFINCPYYDYDISYTPKQSVLEFKNWDQIKTLLEKLIKFYLGEVNLKEIKAINSKHQTNQATEQNTKDQVRTIIQKILGNSYKRPGVSQMQNGIKGKLAKRKIKKKTPKLSLTKVLPSKTMAEPKNHTKPMNHDINNINTDKNEIDNENVVPETEENFNKLQKKSKNKKKNKKIQNVENTEIKGKSGKKINNEQKKQDKSKINKIVPKLKTVPKKLGYKRHLKEKPTKKLCSNGAKNDKGLNNILQEKDSLISRFDKETNSLKKRCAELTKKVEKLLTHRKKRKRKIYINETVRYSSVIKNNKNVSIRKQSGKIVIRDYIPLPPRYSPCTFDNRTWNNLHRKTYKSSYDLVKTIIMSQQISNKIRENPTPNEICSSKETEQGYCISPYTELEATSYNPANEIYSSKETEQVPPLYFISPYTKLEATSHNLPNEICSSKQNEQTPLYSNPYTEFDATSHNAVLQKLTFQSHNYEQQHSDPILMKSPEWCHNRNRQFMTTQSKENFVTPEEKQVCRKTHRNYFRRHFDRKSRKPYERRNHDRAYETMRYNYGQEMLSISFSESQNKHTENNRTCLNITNNEITYITSVGNNLKLTYTMEDEPNHVAHRLYTEFGGTYTIETSNTKPHPQPHLQNQAKHNSQSSSNAREDIDMDKYQQFNYINESKHDTNTNMTSVNHSKECGNNRNELNVVFLSKSQNQDSAIGQTRNDCVELDINVDPLDICEITHSIPSEGKNKEPASHFKNDSLFNEVFDLNSSLLDEEALQNKNQSNYFQEMDNNNFTENNIQHYNKEKCSSINYIIERNQNQQTFENEGERYDINKTKDVFPITENYKNQNNFNLKNRLRFVPKGMSPIFKNCQTKTACDYTNLDEDYYEQCLYDDFLNNVHVNTEILGADVQNVKDLATKEIQRADLKVKKDNASLVFNSKSLKEATILGQVDEKFIATKIRGQPNDSSDVLEYLVLFDQHAVHERIRLEKNLADYLVNDEWKSTALDGITLKMSKDDILYLHNYKDKFAQFGIQWTISDNNEVFINTIPEAVLGKNPRQVETIMKTIQNLITEEINAIKSQKGCVSLYPKSIMNLVFSEACRYAIKFGDKLSKSKCAELIKSLAECKTPFQCAHGRPVMAVLMDIKTENRQYRVIDSKVLAFARIRKQKL